MSLADLRFRELHGEVEGKVFRLRWRGRTAGSLRFEVKTRVPTVERSLSAEGYVDALGHVELRSDIIGSTFAELLQAQLEVLYLIAEAAKNIPGYRGGHVQRSAPDVP